MNNDLKIEILNNLNIPTKGCVKAIITITDDEPIYIDAIYECFESGSYEETSHVRQFKVITEEINEHITE